MEQHIVPRSLGRDDYLIEFGYLHLTGKHLGLAAAAVFVCIAALRNAHLSLPVKIGEIVAALLIFGALAFLKPQRRSLIDWGRRAYQHVKKPRVFSYQSVVAVAVQDDDDMDLDNEGALIQAPGLTRLGMGMGGPDLDDEPVATGHGKDKKEKKSRKEAKAAKAAEAKVQPAVTRTAHSTQELPYIPRSFSGGVGILPDGSAFAEIGVIGVPLQMMDADDLRGVEGHLHNFLNALSFPIEFVVEAKTTNTAPHVDSVKRNFRETPAEVNGFSMAGIKALSWEDAEWYEAACAHYSILDFDLYVVVPAPPGTFGQAAGHLSQKQSRELNENCYAVISGLNGLGATCRRLDNEEMIMDWRDALEPSKAATQRIAPAHLTRALFGVTSLADESGQEHAPRVIVADPIITPIGAPAHAAAMTATSFFATGGLDESTR